MSFLPGVHQKFVLAGGRKIMTVSYSQSRRQERLDIGRVSALGLGPLRFTATNFRF
jgi:hypothetical protein